MKHRADGNSIEGHDSPRYTARLQTLGSARWKQLLGAQAPYRWHIRRIAETPVLDVGCGIGRNLRHLDGKGVGVDTNPHSVAAARSRGLTAYTDTDFPECPDAISGAYRTLLFAHVLEHMRLEDAQRLVADYLPYLDTEGRVIIIVPQEAGFASDPTHVAPVEPEAITKIAGANRLRIDTLYSFPFPRLVGKLFKHNETVGILTRV